MPIVDILRQNAALYPNDDALVELNYDAEAKNPGASWNWSSRRTATVSAAC